MLQLYGNGPLLMEKTLDFLWVRQSITMNNIANVDTPGFKSQYLTFEEDLARRLGQDRGKSGAGITRSLNQTRPVVHTTQTESGRLDGNNVDMVQEQVDLARTAYEYQAAVASISNDISRLRAAAKL